MFAGDEATGPPADGRGRDARFFGVMAIAADMQGNTYLAGYDANRLSLRFVTRDGEVTTLPVTGPTTCSGHPTDLAVGGDGTLYFVLNGPTAVCRRSRAGELSLVAGRSEGISYPVAVAAAGDHAYFATERESYRIKATGYEQIPYWLAHTRALAAHPSGSYYVADPFGIYHFDAQDLSTLMALRDPATYITRIAAEPSGSVIGVATGPRTAEFPTWLQRITRSGQVSTVAGSTELFFPGPDIRIAVDGQGNILYTNGTGVGRLAPDGSHTQVAGRFLAGPGAPISDVPIAVDSAGNVWTYAEWGGPRIRKFSPGGQLLPLGPDGKGLRISEPFTSAAMDFSDNLYLVYARFETAYLGGFIPARGAPTRTEIYKMTPTGAVSRVVDIARGDPGFYSAIALGIDGQGSMIIGDVVSNTVRKVLADGSTQRLGAGLFADPNVPGRMAVSRAGQVMLAGFNDRLFRVEPDGSLRAMVAQGGHAAKVIDGPASTASVSRVDSLQFDGEGQLWFTDGDTIRKLATDGTVTTVVGRPDDARNALGPLPAAVASPTHLQVGPDRNLFVRSSAAILQVTLP